MKQRKEINRRGIPEERNTERETTKEIDKKGIYMYVETLFECVSGSTYM